MLRLDGGEAQPLGGATKKIAALAWSPDGKRIAFVATAPHEPATARVFHDEKSGARHIRRLPFKSDADGLLDGMRKHLFVVDVAGRRRAPDHPAATSTWRRRRGRPTARGSPSRARIEASEARPR